MSFTIVKKSTRRLIGITTALILTSLLAYAFLDSYAKTKRQQVPKTDLVELNIVADKPAGAEAILYESIPEAECIKQITFHSLLSSSSAVSKVAVSSASASDNTAQASGTHQSAPVASSSQKPINREPALVQVSSPKCLKQTAAPMGHEKLLQEGFVGLELNVAQDGRVERGEIEASSGFTDLDSAALKHVVESWQFEPCKKAHQPVACKAHIRFRWQVK